MSRMKDSLLSENENPKTNAIREWVKTYEKLIEKEREEVESIHERNQRALEPRDGSTPWDKNLLE